MGERKTTRRQFIIGHSAVDALGDITHGTLPPPQSISGTVETETDPPGNSYLIHVGRRAMACDWQVMLNADQQHESTEAAIEALDLVDSLEDQLTVFRDHSDICEINRRAAHEDVSVESRLFGLFQLAVGLHSDTDGAFDITSGPLTKRWGFYRREGRMPSQAAIDETLAMIGSQHLRLDADDSSIRFTRSGMEINLGGIGKGHALDCCVDLLTGRGIGDFLIHGGQSSVTARGSRATSSNSHGGWIVGVRHPLRPERRLAEIQLRDRALSTSGSRTQSFYHQGRRYGHILDPRSGWPADGVLSATALAPSAAIADALSTAFYVMGAHQSLTFCERNPDVGLLMVSPAERSGSIEVNVIGLDDDEWQLLDG